VETIRHLDEAIEEHAESLEKVISALSDSVTPLRKARRMTSQLLSSMRNSVRSSESGHEDRDVTYVSEQWREKSPGKHTAEPKVEAVDTPRQLSGQSGSSNMTFRNSSIWHSNMPRNHQRESTPEPPAFAARKWAHALPSDLHRKLSSSTIRPSKLRDDESVVRHPSITRLHNRPSVKDLVNMIDNASKDLKFTAQPEPKYPAPQTSPSRSTDKKRHQSTKRAVFAQHSSTKGESSMLEYLIGEDFGHTTRRADHTVPNDSCTMMADLADSEFGPGGHETRFVVSTPATTVRQQVMSPSTASGAGRADKARLVLGVWAYE